MKIGTSGGRPNKLDLKIASLEKHLKKLKRLKRVQQRIDQVTRKMINWKSDRTMAVILQALSQSFGVSPEEILSQSRTAHIVDARTAFFFFLREFKQLSFPALGKLICRSQSTLVYGCQRLPDRMETDRKFAAKYNAAERQIRQKLKLPGVTKLARGERL